MIRAQQYHWRTDGRLTVEQQPRCAKHRAVKITEWFSMKPIIAIQYDTIEQFNVDSKAEYTA